MRDGLVRGWLDLRSGRGVLNLWIFICCLDGYLTNNVSYGYMLLHNVTIPWGDAIGDSVRSNAVDYCHLAFMWSFISTIMEHFLTLSSIN